MAGDEVYYVDVPLEAEDGGVTSTTTREPPLSIRYNGQTLVQDADYLPSLRVDSNELWITLLRDLQGVSNRLQIALAVQAP